MKYLCTIYKNILNYLMWKDQFAILLWWLWRLRNVFIFNKRELTLEAKVAMPRRYSKEVNSVLSYQSMMKIKKEKKDIQPDGFDSTTLGVDDFKYNWVPQDCCLLDSQSHRIIGALTLRQGPAKQTRHRRWCAGHLFDA